MNYSGTSLVVPWLRLSASTASTAGGTSSIFGLGTEIPHVAWQKKKEEKINNSVACQYFYFLIFIFFKKYIYLLVVLGICCCEGFSLDVASGATLVEVHGLIVVTSLVAEQAL